MFLESPEIGFRFIQPYVWVFVFPGKKDMFSFLGKQNTFLIICLFLGNGKSLYVFRFIFYFPPPCGGNETKKEKKKRILHIYKIILGFEV